MRKHQLLHLSESEEEERKSTGCQGPGSHLPLTLRRGLRDQPVPGTVKRLKFQCEPQPPQRTTLPVGMGGVLREVRGLSRRTGEQCRDRWAVCQGTLWRAAAPLCSTPPSSTHAETEAQSRRLPHPRTRRARKRCWSSSPNTEPALESLERLLKHRFWAPSPESLIQMFAFLISSGVMLLVWGLGFENHCSTPAC